MSYLMRPSTDGAIKVGVLKVSNLLPTALFQTLRVRMVSAAGFEPTTPGFIPLRLSPPPCGRSWSGLSLHPRPKPVGAALPVSTPSGSAGLARDPHRRELREAFPEFEQIRCGLSNRTAQFASGILCSILLSYADMRPLGARKAGASTCIW